MVQLLTNNHKRCCVIQKKLKSSQLLKTTLKHIRQSTDFYSTGVLSLYVYILYGQASKLSSKNKT